MCIYKHSLFLHIYLQLIYPKVYVHCCYGSKWQPTLKVTCIEMTQHVLGSGVTYEHRSIVAGDDVVCDSLIFSSPESQMKVHLFVLCCFIQTFVKHDDIWLLTIDAR